ncbi:MAG: aldose 1-epimerase family protein [Steroidobacteraceae bacterium]
MNAQSWLTIASLQLSAQIDPHGAQLSVLRDGGGRDLLWSGDPAAWAARAPILFPIVGTLNGGHFSHCGKAYPLPRHGFARRRQFEIVCSDGVSATLRLRADHATRAVYPFEFELEVQFRVDGPSLHITASVRNIGSITMPASLGFHPALRWPLPYAQPRNQHFIEFESEEPAHARRISAEGLLLAETVPTPILNRRLVLTDALFESDVLILDQLRSKSLTYGAAAGTRLHVAFPDATCLGLWSKPGAGFICIEPWRGVTDPVGFIGDITDKPGVFLVAPGVAESLRMVTTLRPA